MTDYPPILSFGAGVNSVALAILAVNDGWRGEIVFADTGAEHPETLCHMAYFEREWLAPRGLGVTTLRGLPWQTRDGGIGLVESCQKRRIIPNAFLRWCTVEYKAEPLGRYAADRPVMLGIAADEARRKPDAIRPLVDAGIDRAECVRIIQRAGVPVPPKSGCWICPTRRVAQWRDLWVTHPDLYARAEALEANVQRKAGKENWRATLDPSGRYTLAELRARFEAQTTLDGLDWDGLTVAEMCVCGL